MQTKNEGRAALAGIIYLIFHTVALFIYDKATIELEFLKSRWLSAIAALVLAAISSFSPARWGQRVCTGWAWVVPIGALAVLGYYLVPYFTQ
jgi:hypothetical protein